MYVLIFVMDELNVYNCVNTAYSWKFLWVNDLFNVILRI